jgi:hypothetical protein
VAFQEADVIPQPWVQRAADLAAAMTTIAARIPRDWAKDHAPANPACDDATNKGVQSDG